MISIDTVEIHYFRSIHRVRIKDLSDVSILSGQNDVGKSNLLKAVNLFFNNQSDWDTAIEFERDFSRRRREEVRQETIKGRQYIKVTVGFVRGNRYEKSLPPKFKVSRTWHRQSALPNTTSNLSTLFSKGLVPASTLHRAEASLQRFLNTIRFEYIPAIKDRAFFTYMLGLLQDRILGSRPDGSHIGEAVDKLNSTVITEAYSLREEFEKATGVVADIRLPEELTAFPSFLSRNSGRRR